MYISIHALLAESDDTGNSTGRGNTIFLSTLSLRRATKERKSYKRIRPISIHALLAESDGTKKFKMPVPAYFYPRSPCGERLSVIQLIECGFVFLSTLSLRRATTLICPVIAEMTISIHALLAESDFLNTMQIVIIVIFLSTLSLRRATSSFRFLWC